MSSPRFEADSLPREMVEAWRSDRASTDELRRGYARFVARRRPNRRPVRFTYWLVIGGLLGVGLAQAATHVPWRSLGLGAPVLEPQRRPQKVGAERPNPGAERPSALPLPIASVVETSPSPEPPTLPLPQSEAPARSAGAPAPAAKAAQIQEQWQRASAALRANDFARANQGLLEIERSAPGAEGDAARLARAQLLLSHGRVAEATGLLASLEQRAQSELVRRKAREMLSEPSTPHRSGRGSEDTQQP